jgi:co-chaperonin GroES (HSP10)
LALSCNECQRQLSTSGLRPEPNASASRPRPASGQTGSETDEIPSIARPRRRPPHRRRGKDEGRHHHSRKPQEGEVIAAGPGARDESGKLVPLDLKAVDRVLFGKWSGTEVKIDGEDLLIMKESDVMGVIEGASGAKKKAA